MLDLPAKDDGIAGAKLAIEDNNTTGKFLNQTFKLDVLNGDVDELIKGATEKVAAGDSFIIADLEPDALLKFADAFAGKPAVIFNVGSPDTRLREEDCRANVLHIAPSHAMLADALAQYLVWKKWPNWLLVYGPRPEDKLLADSYRHAAKKFGGKSLRSANSRSRPEAGGPMAVSSRFSSRFRPSCKVQKTTMSSSWPMPAIYSPTTFLIGLGYRAQSPVRRGWSRRAGTRRWSFGAGRSSSIGSSG